MLGHKCPVKRGFRDTYRANSNYVAVLNQCLALLSIFSRLVHAASSQPTCASSVETGAVGHLLSYEHLMLIYF